jgi:2-oxoisovalerate dehydrogenase E1 component
VQEASAEKQDEGSSIAVITWGMGVHWAREAAATLDGAAEILDLRTLHPLDWEAIAESVKRHNKALILTEEAMHGSFAEALAGRISRELFKLLDAPVFVCGAEAVPAMPLNETLEKAVLPDADKVAKVIGELMAY